MCVFVCMRAHVCARAWFFTTQHHTLDIIKYYKIETLGFFRHLELFEIKEYA